MGAVSSKNMSAREEAAPYPASFNQIVDLITNGQPVPGVRDIPNTILSGQGSEPMRIKRKKPWETVGGEDGSKVNAAST